MTRQVALEWQQIQDAIHQWACEATGGLTWLWADQDTSQEPWPYGVLSVVSGPNPIPGSIDEIRWDADAETNTHTGPRSFTIGFQVSVGPPDSNTRPDEGSESILATLHSTIGFQATRDLLYGANVSVAEVLAINPIGLYVGQEFVDRAQMDIRFHTQAALIEAVGPIDKVEIASSYTGNPVYDATDTIDLTGG